ncbi:hypothetical protein DV451_001774 [Geotrichum candidum]|uniref:26S proteasome regulatory subunit RPN1 n=1 Tax=Geotrichum candidum TaxID=1173061 RepID=A0A0J9X8B9_GEOCN|nr:hypothetical protein DV451_001774 [Geotrichum candidum]KAI9212917.1 hypothetical protein DS838_002179 [Geotrichum bryndzae]KAF5110985.1 hypothetical protein DV454_004755 [Geotrichum candidum]KAF5119891.1 hypothetical protein DV452_001408 [Geotrichum candidum]KAF5124961.1 hypothetical protein DV495_003597 [Geotrichum candidum]
MGSKSPSDSKLDQPEQPSSGSSLKKTDKKKQQQQQTEELSEEDEKLKNELEMLVERLKESNTELYEPALESLKNFIRTSTSSMTAVPKPLKFLRPHYPSLSERYDQWPKELQNQLADVLSVLAMTYSGDGKRDSLKYRLLSTVDDIGSWGHEYMRHLALEIGEEYSVRTDNDDSTDDLLALSLKIVPFFLQHNAEADAVDLLSEIEAIEQLPQFVDKNTFARACLYMVSCVPLLAPPDDLAFLHTAYSIYLTHNQLTQALALAIRIDDDDLIRQVLDATSDILVQKQLAFILARQQYWFEVDDEDVQACVSNVNLSEYFVYLAKELNLLDPKVPEDIYKSQLENSLYGSASGLSSAKQNLATAFVNAFVNCGYGTDKLLNTDVEKRSWIYQTKAGGIISTTASLGMINLWDYNNGLQQLDRYLMSTDRNVKAGAILGIGVVNAGVHDESDPALALLDEYLDADADSDSLFQTSALIGIGLAYAGSRRQDLLERLSPLISDTNLSMEVSSLAALALGHIFVGSANGEIASTILQTLLERTKEQLSDKWTRFLALGLGLLFMGKYEQTEEVLETIKAIDHPMASVVDVLVSICSYAGTGNVLKIQELLHNCTERTEVDDDETKEETEKTETPEADAADLEEKKEKKLFESQAQGFSVLGLAMIAMGEDIGQEMVLRHFSHLMHYGEPHIRRAVPLAMGLVSASNPEMKVFDTLSRYSHDTDLDVAINSIYSMGLVGAGTNNARLAQLLRQLASYYSREADSLFTVRIAQGLVHMGKGTLTVNPFNTDRQILSRVSLASLLTVSVALLDPKSFILSSSHTLLYYLTNAIRPRMLITLDENLQPIKVNVRIGQAVDVVGQAGRPKTITGWVTHSTPVLLSYGERAELEDDEYKSLTHSLEGIVILRKNEDRMDTE